MFNDLIKTKNKTSQIYIINNKKCIVDFNKKIIFVTKDFTEKDVNKLFDEVMYDFGKIFNYKWKMTKRENL